MKVDQLFPTKWLHPEALNGRAVTVTIERVTLEKVHNPTTNKDETKPAVAFRGATKLLLMNKTQALAFARILGSGETDDWAGKKVTLAAAVAPNGKQTILVTPVADPVADTNPIPGPDPDPNADPDPDPNPDGGGV